MRRLVVPLAVVLLVSGVFTWWWNQPERVVARRVAGLFNAANVEAGAGTISRGIRGGAIEGYLAPNINFKGPDGPTEEVDGLRSRDGVVSMYSALAKYCREISIQPPEFSAITIDGDEATVEATADAVIELTNRNRPVDGIQNLTMEWRKIDGKWRLASAEWYETGR